MHYNLRWLRRHRIWVVLEPKVENTMVEAVKDMFQKYSDWKSSETRRPKYLNCRNVGHFKQNYSSLPTDD